MQRAVTVSPKISNEQGQTVQWSEVIDKYTTRKMERKEKEDDI